MDRFSGLSAFQPPTYQSAPHTHTSEKNPAAAFKKAMEEYDANALEPHDGGCTYYHEWDSDAMGTARRYVVQARQAGTYNFERGIFVLKTLFNSIMPGKTEKNLACTMDQLNLWDNKQNLAFSIAKTYEYEIARRRQKDPSSDGLESMQEEAEKYRAFVPKQNYCRTLEKDLVSGSFSDAIGFLIVFSSQNELHLSPHAQEMALDCLLTAIKKDQNESRQFLMMQRDHLVSAVERNMGAYPTCAMSFVIPNITPANATPICECIGIGALTEMFRAAIKFAHPNQNQKDRLFNNLIDIQRTDMFR
jgi:hypothetical protein